MRAHQFSDPLQNPGEADLTAHVDFSALARAARAAGAAVHGPVTQGAFLRALGIETRAQRLKRNATAQQAADIDSALQRLTDASHARGMGVLFKVLCVTRRGAPTPPAFEEGAAA
jgi:SAM-dependent MidA family methyltransferase